MLLYGRSHPYASCSFVCSFNCYYISHSTPTRIHQRLTKRAFFLVFFLCLLLGTDLLTNWTLLIKPALAATVSQPTTSRPTYTLQQFFQQGHPYKAVDGLQVAPQRNYTAPFWKTLSQGTAHPSLPPSAEPATLKPISQPLTTSGTALHLVASDAQGMRLEVLVPAGAFDLSKATTTKGAAPQGTLVLTLIQLRGHFAAATTDLGSFQLQITDGQGQVLQGVHLAVGWAIFTRVRLLAATII